MQFSGTEVSASIPVARLVRVLPVGDRLLRRHCIPITDARGRSAAEVKGYEQSFFRVEGVVDIGSRNRRACGHSESGATQFRKVGGGIVRITCRIGPHRQSAFR